MGWKSLQTYTLGGRGLKYKDSWKIIIKDGIIVWIGSVEHSLVQLYWNFLEKSIFKK